MQIGDPIRTYTVSSRSRIRSRARFPRSQSRIRSRARASPSASPRKRGRRCPRPTTSSRHSAGASGTLWRTTTSCGSPRSCIRRCGSHGARRSRTAGPATGAIRTATGRSPTPARTLPHTSAVVAASTPRRASKPAASYFDGYGPMMDQPAFRVIGRVSLWGRVIEGDRGFRASHAYPSHLYVPGRSLNGASDVSPEEVALALTVYGVPGLLPEGLTKRRVTDALVERPAALEPEQASERAEPGGLLCARLQLVARVQAERAVRLGRECRRRRRQRRRRAGQLVARGRGGRAADQRAQDREARLELRLLDDRLGPAGSEPTPRRRRPRRARPSSPQRRPPRRPLRVRGSSCPAVSSGAGARPGSLPRA